MDNKYKHSIDLLSRLFCSSTHNQAALLFSWVTAAAKLAGVDIARSYTILASILARLNRKLYLLVQVAVAIGRRVVSGCTKIQGLSARHKWADWEIVCPTSLSSFVDQVCRLSLLLIHGRSYLSTSQALRLNKTVVPMSCRTWLGRVEIRWSYHHCVLSSRRRRPTLKT